VITKQHCGSYEFGTVFRKQVKSSHLYLYSAFYNTDCIKAASQWTTNHKCFCDFN